MRERYAFNAARAWPSAAFAAPLGATTRRCAFGALAAAVLFGALGPAPRAADVDSQPVLPEVQVAYLERCGGCHGIQGHSAASLVPQLQGQVSSFLCLPEGRDYLIRLPSVALSPLSDGELASLMNFVVFDLGAVPGDRARFPPYTAAEVGTLRKQPLNEVALAGYRAAIVTRLIRQCGAPSTLRDYVSARAY